MSPAILDENGAAEPPLNRADEVEDVSRSLSRSTTTTPHNYEYLVPAPLELFIMRFMIYA